MSSFFSNFTGSKGNPNLKRRDSWDCSVAYTATGTGTGADAGAKRQTSSESLFSSLGAPSRQNSNFTVTGSDKGLAGCPVSIQHGSLSRSTSGS
uniref:Uncharacterized protein n=1 Tax=Chromera velia CCMP2878 TaxID=1169474 RepID=A0A0G4F877_9ALVE|eukprot:Cvel_15501.t1-p1 / transcript=Cvel_15501.t1 / gene=Cvel_15501 / organism=Chromera_velia_CCMP2878 / gene_product=hypothetical protein / transcript_product=hypothetical protein / location=Cvel_scaffold1150:30638-31980(-) / protein_length=93 / sequence_SO=supercontig / SO=protein_coding / is_pseudo=false